MKNVAWWRLSSSILCATETAHDKVRRHLCRKTNPHSCRKTNPTGAKLKIYSKESTCRSFGSWFMVYIRSSNEGEQETNYEARNNESVVSKFCTSHLKFRPPSRFVFWRGRDTLQQSAARCKVSLPLNVRTMWWLSIHYYQTRTFKFVELVWSLFSCRRTAANLYKTYLEKNAGPVHHFWVAFLLG